MHLVWLLMMGTCIIDFISSYLHLEKVFCSLMIECHSHSKVEPVRVIIWCVSWLVY